MNAIDLFTTISSAERTSFSSLLSIEVIALFIIAFLICISAILSADDALKLKNKTIYHKLLFAITLVLGAFIIFNGISILTNSSIEDAFVQNLSKPRSESYVIDSVKLSSYEKTRDINKANELSFKFGCLSASRALYLEACDSFYVKDLPARAIALTGDFKAPNSNGELVAYSRNILSLKQGAELGEAVVSGLIPFSSANKFVASASDDAKSFYFGYVLNYYKEDSSFSSLKAFTNLVKDLSKSCLNLPRPICNDFKRAYVAAVAEYAKKPTQIGNLDALFEDSLDFGAKLQ